MISGVLDVEDFREDDDEYVGTEKLIPDSLGSDEENKKKYNNFDESDDYSRRRKWVVNSLHSLGDFIDKRVQDPVIHFLSRSGHFLKYNFGEVMKRRCGYSLGILSVVLVVIACTTTISVTEQLPLVFLRIAENNEGQYDVCVESDKIRGWSLNFTDLVRSIRKGSSDEQYKQFSLLSPRMLFGGKTHVNSHESCIRKKNGERLPIWYNSNNREEISWVYEYADSIILNQTNSECTPFVNKYGEYKLSCEEDLCNNVNVPLVLIDTEREKEMGFGRNWDFDKMGIGECVITDSLADRMNLGVGDDILIGGEFFGYEIRGFLGLLQDVGYIDTSKYYAPKGRTKWTHVDTNIEDSFKFPCEILGISEGHQGKTDYVLSIDESAVFMEYEHFYFHLGMYLDMKKFSQYANEIQKSNPYNYAHWVYLNAQDRAELYNSANFQEVRDRVTDFAGKFLYLAGFDQVSVYYPLLTFLEGITFIGLFLSLIINIIITILIGLSVVLIYSLLMINVEERTFEMGVLRMIGLQLRGLIEMIIMQSMMYSIPGIFLGLFIGQILYFVISSILFFYLKASVPYILTWESVLTSVLVGIVIPLAGSIIPIRKAMSASLQQSLDTKRSKVKAIKIKIERMSDRSIPWSIVVISIGSFGFGFFIYYFFPLALITQRFQLLLFVFFGILLMMLVGCVLLSINLEGILQNIVTRMIFFWEYASVRKLVMKNLIAHKIRNRKTTIMYGISLGFLIFLSVSTRLEIRLYQYSQSRIMGTRFRLACYWSRIPQKDLNLGIIHDELDNLVESEKCVESYAYMSFPISKMTNDTVYVIQTIGNYHFEPTDLSAISPNFYDVLDEDYLIIKHQDKEVGLGVAEQLYSVDGGYGFMGGLGEQKEIAVTHTLDENVVFRMQRSTEQYTKFRYFLKRYNSVLESGSSSTFSKYDTETSIHMELFTNKEGADGFVSFPEMYQLIEHEGTYSGVDEIPIRFVFIRTSKSCSEDEVQGIGNRIKRFKNDNRLWFHYEDRKERLDRLQVIDNVLSIFFYLSTILAMLMCFFSLIANMITNVQEQNKEIGILRAIGCRIWTLKRVYVYEAIVVIYTAGIIGTATGSFIAYTFVLQQQLFTQLPLGFVFPYEIVLIVILGGIFCGFLASYFPIHFLLRKVPVEIMKKV